MAQAAGIDLERAKALPPLPGKPAPGERRASTYTDGTKESAAHTNDTVTQTAQAAE